MNGSYNPHAPLTLTDLPCPLCGSCCPSWLSPPPTTAVFAPFHHPHTEAKLNQLWNLYYLSAQAWLRKTLEEIKPHRECEVNVRPSTKKQKKTSQRRCLVILDLFCGLQVPGNVIAKFFIEGNPTDPNVFDDVYLVTFDLLKIDNKGSYHHHVIGDLMGLDLELVDLLRSKYPKDAEVGGGEGGRRGAKGRVDR
jgi:hypothetical protein